MYECLLQTKSIIIIVDDDVVYWYLIQ